MKRRCSHHICGRYVLFDVHVEGLGKDKQAIFAKLHKIKQFITCWNYQLEDTLHNLDYNLSMLSSGLNLLSSEVY